MFLRRETDNSLGNVAVPDMCQSGIPHLNRTNSPASVSVCALTGLTGQECLTALAENLYFLTNKFLQS